MHLRPILCLATWVCASLVVACAQPDQIELNVTFDEVDRSEIGEVVVLVDAPRGFTREDSGELAPGISYQFVPQPPPAPNRLALYFRPVPGADALADRLVLTLELSGALSGKGAATAVGFDRLGQAVASASRSDIALSGFEEVTLQLSCPDEMCSPQPFLGSYPVTIGADAGRGVVTPVGAPPELVIAHGPGTAMPPADADSEIWAFGDPEYDGGRGRVLVVPTTEMLGAVGDFASTQASCVITGDSPGDRFGSSVVILTNAGLAVGAPGADGGNGAVYIYTLPVLECGQLVASDDPGGDLIRLTSATDRNLGSALAFTSQLPLVIAAPQSGGLGSVWFVNEFNGPTYQTLAPADNPFTVRASVVRMNVAATQTAMTLAVPFGNTVPVVAVGVASDGLAAFFRPPPAGEDVDVDQLVATVLRSTQPGFGHSLLWLHDGCDVDCNLAIGAPGAVSPGGTNTGAVIIYSNAGLAGGFKDRGVDCDVLTNLCLYGQAEGDEFGFSLARGHFRAPGDLVVGAPGVRRPDDGSQAGAVYVLSSLDTWPSARPFEWHSLRRGYHQDDPAIPLLFRVFGLAAGDRFGTYAGAASPDSDGALVVAGVGDGQRPSIFAWPRFDETWGAP